VKNLSCSFVGCNIYCITYDLKRKISHRKGFLSVFPCSWRTKTAGQRPKLTLQMRDFSVLWNRMVTISTCVILSICLRPSFASADLRPKQYARQNIDVSKMRAARAKLPSETAKEKKEKFFEKPLIKATLKAAPAVLVAGGVGYIGYQAYVISEKKKIQQWQQVLQRQFQSEKEDEEAQKESKTVRVENNTQKEDVSERRVSELSRLELFHKNSAPKDAQVEVVTPELEPKSSDPVSSLLSEYLRGNMDIFRWNETSQELDLPRQKIVERTKEFCTSYLNSIFDKTAKASEMDDRTRIENMLFLLDQLRKLERFSTRSNLSSDLSDMQWLHYSGTATEKQIEETYRLLAIHFFSSESSIRDGMEKLPSVQRYLKLSDEKFHSLNQEVAKAIFQVAVSNTLSEGKLDDESRQALENLKKSFTNMIDNESAENIISEVGLMRVMYALQQILKEQQFGDDDIQMLKSMCEQLGVNLESLLKTAEDMGDSMGPQVKEFVQQLRSFLSKTSEEKL